MRLLVTGRHGQVAAALATAPRPKGVELVAIGRPQLDLDRPETVGPAILAARPDVLISAAAFTAVDQAEAEPDAAFRANADSVGELATAARKLGAPMLHLSTDYVFDGSKLSPYVESDRTEPRSIYGASKLAGEQAALAAQPEVLVLRTAWVHAPFGKNFVRTMLRLAQTRDEVAVVADQYGSPSYAPDIAQALLDLAIKAQSRPGPFGVHHMTGAGETSWASFAAAIFEGSRRRGGPYARVRPISSREYPTPAPRPANSRLDCSKLARDWNVSLPPWSEGLERGLNVLLGAAAPEGAEGDRP